MSASPSSVLAAAIVAAGIAGCSSTDPPPPPPPPPPPTGLVIAQATPSGDGQTAIVATALPSQLRVEVTDNGSPVSGRTVAWATTGGGSVTASSDTDASGIATSQWTLGQSAGSQSASATLSGAGGSPLSFTATASAGVAAFIAKAGGDAQSGIITTTLTNPLLARATDQFNNPVSGVSVTWQVTSGMATALPASGNTASNGEAQTMVTIGGTAGPIVIQAMSTGLSGSPLDYSATALPLPMAVTVQLLDAPTSFSPQHITIAAGGTVTWTWSSAGVITHNVMPDATEPVISGTPVTGPNSYPFTFNTPGTYMYYCVVHGFPGGVGMFGTVTVI